ncbi:MAG TPA: C40 family peptidase [Chryseosolibacter sp.]
MHGKRTIINKRKLFLYLFGIFIVVRVAANISRGHDGEVHHFPGAYLDDPKLHKKLLAFIKGGVEKEVNTRDYDVDGVIGYAESLLGTPHVMGGYSPTGLDCSGLVKLAHEQFGVTLPRSSHDQGRYGKIIYPGEELKRGDLVFFHSTYSKPELITHSGIYLGENKFIHTSTSRGVSISTLLDSGYWQRHYLFATRLVN